MWDIKYMMTYMEPLTVPSPEFMNTLNKTEFHIVLWDFRHRKQILWYHNYSSEYASEHTCIELHVKVEISVVSIPQADSLCNKLYIYYAQH